MTKFIPQSCLKLSELPGGLSLVMVLGRYQLLEIERAKAVLHLLVAIVLGSLPRDCLFWRDTAWEYASLGCIGGLVSLF